MQQRHWSIASLVASVALLLGAASGAATQVPDEPPDTAAAGPPSAAEPPANPIERAPQPFTMRIGARVQVRLTHTDPAEADASNVVAIRRARLSLSGAAYERFDYAVQVELAGAAARLLDANVRYTVDPLLSLWFGQGKAFFGRQFLTSSGNLQFVDRSLVDGRFSAGRQQGAAITGSAGGGVFEYNAGIYNGNGINETTNPNDRFMTVGRLVLAPFGAYPPVESAHDYPARPRLALGVSALRNTIGEAEAETEITRFGSEGAFKVGGLNLTAELFRERADPALGERLTTNGWYSQVGFLFPDRSHEIAGRYGLISPDTPVVTDLIETGLAYSYYFRAHSAKLQADLRNIRARETGSDHREFRVQFQLAL